MKKKKLKTYIINFLILISLLFCGYFAFKIYQDNSFFNAPIINQETQKIITANNLNEDKEKLEIKNQVKDYQDIYNNKDIKGILKFPNTEIETPLVQAKNNEYYLKHSLDKKKDIRGSTFIDYRTPLKSKQVNIYGHNSKTVKTPFKELENYINKEYYEEHKYFLIDDGITINKYKIVSVYIDKGLHEHIIVKPTNLKDHIDKLSQSLYKTGEEIDLSDDLVIIQTCWYNPKNSYLIIVSKKVKEVTGNEKN